MSRGTIAVCLPGILLLSGCWLPGHPIGIDMRSKTQFQSEWKNYLEMKDPKALAVTGDVYGVYASGFADDAASEQAAVTKALRDCEDRRADKQIIAPCWTYAVGDEILPPP